MPGRCRVLSGPVPSAVRAGGLAPGLGPSWSVLGPSWARLLTLLAGPVLGRAAGPYSDPCTGWASPPLPCRAEISQVLQDRVHGRAKRAGLYVKWVARPSVKKATHGKPAFVLSSWGAWGLGGRVAGARPGWGPGDCCVRGLDPLGSRRSERRSTPTTSAPQAGEACCSCARRPGSRSCALGDAGRVFW